MSDFAGNSVGSPGRRWRALAWGAAAALVFLPLLAMQFTDEVAWGVGDFLAAAGLLGAAGLAFEAAVIRSSGNAAYRAGAALALAAALLLVWLNLAVGVLGSENDPANLMYAGVLAIAVGGAAAARLRPAGMARAALATALAQILVAAIALPWGLGSPGSGPLEILALNALFALLWLTSALLFRKAARAMG